MKAFEIKVGGRSLDYRTGGNLEIDDVRKFFENKLEVVKIWQGGRHILADVKKDGRDFFLKLATSEGISEVTKVEYDWNAAVNEQVDRKSGFCVPKNFEGGHYRGLLYFVAEKFNGKLLVDWPKEKKADVILANLDRVLDFCEFIGGLKLKNLVERFHPNYYYKKFFVDQTLAWLEAVPADVCKQYRLDDLYQIVVNGVDDLSAKPRHGDFAPWHIFKLGDEKLGLIDGEHALAAGVENYDICYFIQRVFSVLEMPDAAGQIMYKLARRNYELGKIRTVLAARAIGGFLDKSFSAKPNYLFANKFKGWVLSI